MKAAEVIELFNSLTTNEQAQVRAFVNQADVEKSPVRFIPKEEFEKIAPKIFADNRELLRKLAQ